jgi:putative endonuclease
MKDYYVYILASKKYGVLYIGVTNNLLRRVYEHKNKLTKGFTEKYFVGKLVYFEQTDSIEAAIVREKQMKRWKREWKIELIEKMNPEWNDLYYEYGGKDVDEALKDYKIENDYKN